MRNSKTTTRLALTSRRYSTYNRTVVSVTFQLNTTYCHRVFRDGLVRYESSENPEVRIQEQLIVASESRIAGITGRMCSIREYRRR
jgi:hypothetical protein